MQNVRHFLTLTDFSPVELHALIGRAMQLKAAWKRGEVYEPLKNRTLAMIFEKSSTRTRVSFEAGMAQLGGHALFYHRMIPNWDVVNRLRIPPALFHVW